MCLVLQTRQKNLLAILDGKEGVNEFDIYDMLSRELKEERRCTTKNSQRS